MRGSIQGVKRICVVYMGMCNGFVFKKALSTCIEASILGDTSASEVRVLVLECFVMHATQHLFRMDA